MAKFIDNECNVEFESDKDYLAHKKAGHIGLLEKSTPIDAPPEAPHPDIPAEALPTQDFIDQVSRIEKKVEEVQTPASQHPSELPPVEPIKLTYKYIGQCPEHRVPADTLELDVAGEHFCVAVCPTGKEQLDTKKAVKL